MQSDTLLLLTHVDKLTVPFEHAVILLLPFFPLRFPWLLVHRNP